MCRNLIAVIVLAATTFVAKVPSSQPALAPAGLSIRVAVPENATVPVGGGRPALQVVIENTSATPQGIIDEWNSWGYFNLTLDYTLPNGIRKSMAKKHDVIWTMNYPSFTTLQPGQCLVRDVFFDPKIWSGLPEVTKDTVVSVTATLTQDENGAAIWHGNIQSAPVQVSMRAKY